MKKPIFIISCIVLIISISFMVKSFTTPKQIEKTITENKLNINTKLTPETHTIPSLLHPSGGKVIAKDVIFTKVVDELYINVESNIEAEKPVNINANYDVVLKVKAKDLWEKEYVLLSNQKLNMNNTKSIKISKRVPLNLKDKIEFVKKVAEQLSINPGKYHLTISMPMEGTIEYNQSRKQLEKTYQLNMEYTNNQINVITQQDNENISKKEGLLFVRTETLAQKINVFGINISVVASRLFFLSLAFISLILVLKYVFSNIPELSEAERIDRKYRTRLVRINEDISFVNKQSLYMEGFKELIKIADEKELIIFRYDSNTATSFYIIDGSYVYVYRACKNTELSSFRSNHMGGSILSEE